MLSAIGALAKTMDMSNLIATIMLILFMLMDGTWVSLERIPDSIEWVGKLSFMGLAVQRSTTNLMELITLNVTRIRMQYAFILGRKCSSTTSSVKLKSGITYIFWLYNLGFGRSFPTLLSDFCTQGFRLRGG